MAPCALIFWLTAERQHCLFNVRRVKGHCIAFVRSAVEVTLSSGPSCCRQLGHATYIESNYPCQLITAKFVPSHNTHTQNSPIYNECPSVCMLVSFFNTCTCRHTRSIGHRNPKRKGSQQTKASQVGTIESRTIHFRIILASPQSGTNFEDCEQFHGSTLGQCSSLPITEW